MGEEEVGDGGPVEGAGELEGGEAVVGFGVGVCTMLEEDADAGGGSGESELVEIGPACGVFVLGDFRICLELFFVFGCHVEGHGMFEFLGIGREGLLFSEESAEESGGFGREPIAREDLDIVRIAEVEAPGIVVGSSFLPRHAGADEIDGEGSVGAIAVDIHPVGDFLRRSSDEIALPDRIEGAGFVEQFSRDGFSVEVNFVDPHLFTVADDGILSGFRGIVESHLEGRESHGGDDAAVFPEEFAPEEAKGSAGLSGSLEHFRVVGGNVSDVRHGIELGLEGRGRICPGENEIRNSDRSKTGGEIDEIFVEES